MSTVSHSKVCVSVALGWILSHVWGSASYSLFYDGLVLDSKSCLHLVCYPTAGSQACSHKGGRRPRQRVEAGKPFTVWSQNRHTMTFSIFCWLKQVTSPSRFKEWENRALS